MQTIWPTLRPQLEHLSDHFPVDALALAEAHRDEVAPHLVDVLTQLAADTSLADGGRWALHMWAMHLLAAWRDTRAYAPLLALAHHDEDTLDQVLGDVMTESLQSCLASVCDGNVALLQALFEDTSACVWARDAALDAMKIRVLEGDGDREELVDYLMAQGKTQAARLRMPQTEFEAEEVINTVVNVAREVAATELGPLIENWFADGLLDPMVTDSLEWIQTGLKEPFAAHQERMVAGDKGYVRNVQSVMGWMWRPEPPADFHPYDDPQDHPFDAIQSRLQNDGFPAHPEWTPPVTFVREEPKVGRNDPCPCGSGKKFKKCCGA